MSQQGKQMRVRADKIFHANQENWFYWLTVTGMRLIPNRFFFFICGKILYPF
jgi:hypothetical protein